MNGSWIPSHLQVTIHQARDLALKSKSVNSEVYVLVQIEKERDNTSLLPRHSCPRWNQTFEIPLMSLDSSLDIQVKQKGKFSEDYLGHIHIPLTNLNTSRSSKRVWYKLHSKPGKISTKVRGDLLVSTRFLSNWNKDSTFTSPIDAEIGFREGRIMLRRTKSEYKSKQKESPKQDRTKSRGMFRLRSRNKQVFEECEDFEVCMPTVHSPSSPLTPTAEIHRDFQINSISTISNHSNGSPTNSLSPQTPQDHNIQPMFSETTELEKSGVMELWHTDPTCMTRLEEGLQMLQDNGRDDVEMEWNNEDVKKSPISRAHAFRHKRPFSSFSLNRTRDQLSFDEDLHRKSGSVTSMIEKRLSSTPNSNSSPKPSPAVTYRAKSMKRKGKSSSFNHDLESNTSIDVESTTSEYYSSTSINETPSSPVTVDEHNPSGLSPKYRRKEWELGREKDENGGSLIDGVEQLKERESRNIVDINSDEVATLRPIPDAHKSKVSLSKAKSFGGSSTHPSVPRFKISNHSTTEQDHSSLSEERKETSLPIDDDIDDNGVKLRKARKRVMSEAEDFRRHSTDINELLRLAALSQGKNDGLENVLNADQLKQRLKRQPSTDVKRHTVGMVTSQEHPAISRSSSSTPISLQTIDSCSEETAPSSNSSSVTNGKSNETYFIVSEQIPSDSESSSGPPDTGKKTSKKGQNQSFTSKPVSSIKTVPMDKEVSQPPPLIRGNDNKTQSFKREPIKSDKIISSENDSTQSSYSPPITKSSKSNWQLKIEPIMRNSSFHGIPSSVSSSVVSSNTTSNTTSLDSSYSSVYIHNDLPDEDLSQTDSQSTTPSQMTPPFSSTPRESTPSPELPSLEGTEEVDGAYTPKSKDVMKEKQKVKHTVVYKQISQDRSKALDHMPPLPPSLSNKYSTLPSRGKFASAADITSLLAETFLVSPQLSFDKDTSPINVRPVSQCNFSFSANNSGRTSPVLEEEKEKDEAVIHKNGGFIISPLSPLSSNSNQTQSKPEALNPSPVKPLPKLTYESGSLPRRKTGGLKRALSLYHDNRKEAAITRERKALVRRKTMITPSNSAGNSPKLGQKGAHKSVIKKNNEEEKHTSPLETQCTEQSDETIKPSSHIPTSIILNFGALSNTSNEHQSYNANTIHENYHSGSQSNDGGQTSSQSTNKDTPSGHFILPPPPDVSHTPIAGQISGLGNTRNDEESREEENNEQMEDNESNFTSSSEIEEELSEEELKCLTREELVTEIIQLRSKLTKKSQKLTDTQCYLDSLLAKVMETHPELLMSNHHS